MTAEMMVTTAMANTILAWALLALKKVKGRRKLRLSQKHPASHECKKRRSHLKNLKLQIRARRLSKKKARLPK
jgi:hypothetical protein